MVYRTLRTEELNSMPFCEKNSEFDVYQKNFLRAKLERRIDYHLKVSKNKNFFENNFYHIFSNQRIEEAVDRIYDVRLKRKDFFFDF